MLKPRGGGLENGTTTGPFPGLAFFEDYKKISHEKEKKTNRKKRNKPKPFVFEVDH